MGAAKKLRAVPEATPPESASMDGELKFYPAGSLLVRENEYSRKMFIIKKGKVRVSKDYMGQRITLAILGEGEVFGELSFFDSAPRSASCDALTDLEVIVIDGKEANDQIAGLPSWVIPIFKTVFHRFREADQKITVLQSMNEFQRRVGLTDSVAKSVYMELLRFIRTLELVYSRSQKNGSPMKESLYKELDEILGKRVVGLAVFWKVLRENDMLDARVEDFSGEVSLNLDALKNWREYLSREMEAERFLLLSFSAMAILRKIVARIFEEKGDDFITSETEMQCCTDDMKLHGMPLYKDGLQELQKQGLVRVEDTKVRFTPSALIETFNFQNLLKSFDHTIVNLD